ncbi:MAG TPA: PA domain-containing protein, partial [Ignavibacteria bacterium]|nr:PA domain-containing protein [Ignavibacteria bacterium]
MFKKVGLFVIVLFTGYSFFGFSDPNTDITSGELKEHIVYLSSGELEGRFPGTEGDRLAQQYIIDQFKSYGLKPGGDNGTYIQNFQMTTSVAMGMSNSFSSGSNNFTLGLDFTPLGFSTDGSASGSLVFAGYGITATENGYDDYADIDVSGKIAVILRYTPNPHNAAFQEQSPVVVKTIKAKEKGAVGIIFVSGPVDEPDDGLLALSFSNSFRDAGIPVINITRSTFDKLFSTSGKTISALQDEINNSGKPSSFELNDVSVNMQTDVDLQQVTTGNVIGILEGNDPNVSDEAIVIGAHYDHVGYGAY